MRGQRSDPEDRLSALLIAYLPSLAVAGLLLAACTSPEADDLGGEESTQGAMGRFSSLEQPLTHRSEAISAGIGDQRVGTHLWSGEYRVAIEEGAVVVSRPGSPVALALQPLGPELNLLAFDETIETFEREERAGVTLSGSAPWADFTLLIEVYPHNPGLIHYGLDFTPMGESSAGSAMPEWAFVDPMTGNETAAGYEAFADRAAGAAPSFYGYSETFDSTLLYWLDLTRLNPFTEATGFSTTGTPLRRGRRFGHNLSTTDLGRLPLGESVPLYESFLYLTPGSPADETAMFHRYLIQVSDIYDMLARPIDPLPDWQRLAAETFVALDDPDTWIELDGQRYWRAYVSDTRQSAEAITQLDVALGVARYIVRYGEGPAVSAFMTDTVAGLDHFFNPVFGLIQNSGPLATTGDQTRGDTWYEVGHALKAAELGLLGYPSAAELAELSQSAWIGFAQKVDYEFPQFYSFSTWDGTGREPDAAGGYALYMLRLADLGCGQPCLDQAENAVRAFEGHGFGFAYETHMTAAAALAAGELAQRTGDNSWLEYAYGPVANLLRLSWLYEVDYGPAGPARTFFGLAPTQRANAITPKEQYEAWIYLTELLHLTHGNLDPDVEKLLAEFSYHTLVTLADSLPPRLPDGVATRHPSAYETVSSNRLDLAIPLEDMRGGRDLWGIIGQQVYGAGMAPTFAALAYQEVVPGVVIYSGYPIVKSERDGSRVLVTWTGATGYQTPVKAWGLTKVTLEDIEVPLVPCGEALCFDAEAQQEYVLETVSNA
jgi:hypothetical protein